MRLGGGDIIEMLAVQAYRSMFRPQHLCDTFDIWA